MPRSDDKASEPEADSLLVQPIESVEEQPPASNEKCWNCQANLAWNGTCPQCGFDKNLLSNMHLDAERAARKQAS